MSQPTKRTLSPIERMIDQACGLAPGQVPPPPPSREPPPEAAQTLLQIADAAELWWKGHRPVGWSLRKHLANPTVNITTDRGRPLALAVARWKQLGG